MKHLLTIAILCIISSCCDEEVEIKPICSQQIDDRCQCPEETHYSLDLDQTLCQEKAENIYLASFTGNNCFREGNFDAFDRVGIAITFFPFSGGGNGLTVNFGESENVINGASGCNFTDFLISENTDGSLDVEFEYVQCSFHNSCLDWAERTDCTLLSLGGVIGHFKGKSNADRTKYEFDIEWIDCHDVVLDTGQLSLWQ